MTGIIYGSLTGALVFCLIFVYHYYKSGEKYLRLWSAAWGLNFLAHLFYLNAYLAETQLLSSIFLFHTAYLSGALLFLYGIYSFLQENISQKWLYAAALALVTGLIFSVILNNPVYLNTFAFILIGLVYISMGGKLWRSAGFSLMKIISVTSILFGLINIFNPYFIQQNWFIPPGQIILAALGLIFALGLKGLHYRKIEDKLDEAMKDLQEKKERLENSEKRYRTIFNSAPIGIMIEDKEGNILDANATMEEFTGINKEELEGSNVLDKFVSPENQEDARENIDRLLQGEDLQFEITGSSPRGKTVHRQLTETRINLPQGDMGILSMHLDITERRKKEKIIEELHEVALNLKDLTRETEVLNETIEAAENILDLDFCSISLAENDQLVPKVYSEKLEGKINKRAIDDSSIAGKTYQQKKSFLVNDTRANSLADPLQSSFLSAISVPIGEYGIFQAAAQTKEAFFRKDLERAELLISHTNAALARIYSQEELEDKNILLTSILESIQDGISVLNPDLTIRYTNSTMQEWYAENKPLSGKKCFQAYHQNKSPCQDCPVLRSLESGEMEKEVVPGKTDSEIDYLELHAYPIFDENNEEITGIVEFVRDITDRKQQKRELELTKFAIDRADLIVMRTTSEGEVKYANETTVKKLGYSKDELIGIRGEDFIAEADYVDREKFWQKIKESESIVYEREMITKNGEKFPAEITSQYYQYEEEEFEFVFARDITERKNKEQEIQYLLYRDPLTDLYNRRFIQEEMQRLDTERQLPISIIMVDINGLKIINDSFGHDKGDELLVKTAELLQETVREEDILARYGGDEFVVLLPQTSEKFARKIVKRIKDKCQKTRNEELTISIGAGVATKEKKHKSLEDILNQADDNMYKDKLVSSRSRKHEVVEGLLNTLAANSSETINHARRMEKLAEKLGKRLGLSESQLNRLSLLATLHDIGKASINKEILTKPEELTEEEWGIIKEHAKRGYKIASASEEFALVAEEILSHHEWWNGQGYPRGLQGEEIPLLARIISLVDAYDVMTNDRPYKKAKSQDEALEEIKNCAGSQFDPNLAEEFISMFK